MSVSSVKSRVQCSSLMGPVKENKHISVHAFTMSSCRQHSCRQKDFGEHLPSVLPVTMGAQSPPLSSPWRHQNRNISLRQSSPSVTTTDWQRDFWNRSGFVQV